MDPFAVLLDSLADPGPDWSSFWAKHDDEHPFPIDFAFPLDLDLDPHPPSSSFPFTFPSPSSTSTDDKYPPPHTDFLQPKLPIPRLISSLPPIPASSRHPKHTPDPHPYLSSSAFSSPSPPPATPTSDSPSSVHPIPVPIVPPARPKTSHTTIERRYRTNLNARIQSLKAAVPALRVLDQSTTIPGDLVDERGYIDGVKVARKGSKANVLGKAVEYICVLKRRELRLKREQEGLRTLILGIPGVQPLLAEWDHEWLQKFGGPERDEIDNDLEPYEATDDEDGDREDDGDDSERVRKKPKLTKPIPPKKDKLCRPLAPAAGPSTDSLSGLLPEKRKRGRPRKIQPNIPIAPTAPTLPTIPVDSPMQATTHVPQPQQYLLAVFTLFSFFNSPFASTPAFHPHTHQGSVLSHLTVDPSTVQTTTSWSWNSLIQVIHLFASVLVIFTIVFPWLPLPRHIHPAKIMRLIPFSFLIYRRAAAHHSAKLSLPLSPDVSDIDSDGDTISTERTTRQEQCKDMLSVALSQRGSQHEREGLIHALGLTSNALDTARHVFTRRTALKSSNPELERRAWLRLAELIALHPSSAPVLSRLQIYLRLSLLLRASCATTNHACDLATFALLSRSLTLFYVQDRSQKLWDRARSRMSIEQVRPHERLVLNMLSLEEAAHILTSTSQATSLTPLDALATTLLHQRLRSHTSDLFLQTVSRTQDGALSASQATAEAVRWRETVDASQSLGGSIGVVAESFAKVWEGRVLNVKDLVVDDEHTKTFLTSIVLFRSIFSSRSGAVDSGMSFILSPPSSPPARAPQTDAVLQLRRALASSVFEEQSDDRDGLEDARDRVVDMLVEYERRGRNRP